MKEAKIVLTKFKPEGDIAKIDGIIKDKYFEVPMTGNMLIKENGQWKWYGNQIPKSGYAVYSTDHKMRP